MTKIHTGGLNKIDLCRVLFQILFNFFFTSSSQIDHLYKLRCRLYKNDSDKNERLTLILCFQI